MQSLLLGTTNPAKLLELRRLIEGLPLTLVSPDKRGLQVVAPEEGASHRENAIAKAWAWSRAAGTLGLSSDGGLVIPALGDAWDSLRTHRFAGEVDDAGRAQELLRWMKGFVGEERRIFWREAVAVAESGEPLASWEVEGGHGLLVEEFDPARLVPDFWVAGLWHFPRLGKTYGEMDQGERQQVNDHWSQLRALVQGFFRGYLGP